MKIKKVSIILIALTALTIFSAYILPSAYEKESSAAKILSDSTISDTSKVTYSCPMHPEVISHEPGTCPKCGMDLVPQKNVDKEQGMNSCPNMEKCKQMGCNMDNCRGSSRSCMEGCPMIKEHNHNSDDNSSGHKHKSGCKKGC